jgi:ribosomal protein L3 glutamine methyltransferase
MKPVTLIEQLNESFKAADLYYGHGTDNPWDEAVNLVLHHLDEGFNVSDEELERELDDKVVAKIEELAKLRIEKRIPLAYLIKMAYFFDLPFYVDERVIIPRSPIAELIEGHFRPWVKPEQVHSILDMCTGSGCLAIACAYAFEEAKVDAVDISPDALQVAEINNKKLETDNQVTLIQSDLFEKLEGKKYDVIISNPPYVSFEEMAEIPAEYNHEPRLALEADDDGLVIALRIIREAAKHLNDKGVLIMEVGNAWIELEGRYPKVPFVWLEFARGGEGVFMLTKEDLLTHQEKLMK